MPAEIIPFPQKTIYRRVKSVDLYHCWDRQLNNPFLNSLFKQQVPYVERWYLQTVHLLNLDQTDHPLINVLFSKTDSTLPLLLEATEKDLKIQHEQFDIHTAEAAKFYIGKLNKWRSKWQGLLLHREQLENF